MARNRTNNGSNGTGANLGFEATLWAAADKMRNNMDAAEYKHVVLGLIFLKYISDSFEERHQQLSLWTTDPKSKYYIREPAQRYDVVEDRDEYTSESIFLVLALADQNAFRRSIPGPGGGSEMYHRSLRSLLHNLFTSWDDDP